MQTTVRPARSVWPGLPSLAGLFAALFLSASPPGAQPSILQHAILQGQPAARDSAQKYYLNAARMASEGRYGPAVAELRRAMEFLPNEPQLKVDMAVLLSASGDPASAIRELEPLAERSNPYGPAVIQLGDFRLAEGDTTGALSYYYRLTTGQNAYPPALLRVGDVFQAQGKRADAIRYYRQAVRTDSSFIEGWLSLGSVLVVMDRYAEALEAFDRAIAIDPEGEATRELRRLALLRKEDHEEGMATGKMRARIIVTQTRQEAETVRQELLGGADFIALAMRHSVDQTAEVGGDLGFFGEGEMIPIFEQAVRQLSAGQISPILQLPTGFAIIVRVN